jgi:hypothetical protein
MAFPVFAPGDVLNASDMNAVGLWLVKTQTINANVSSVIVTDAFSDDYDDYLILYKEIDSFSGNQFTNIQLRTGSTTTTTGYYTAGYTTSAYAGSLATAFVNNGSAWNVIAAGPNSIGFGTVLIMNPFKAVPTGYSASYFYDAGTGHVQGYQSASTSFDQFVITGASANLNGGTITVYGIRKP